MTYRNVLLLLFLLLALTGCGGEEEPGSQTVQLGEPFVLAGGQEANVDPPGLRIVFSEVLEDSRCPSQVDCVQAGEANIRLTVTLGELPPADLDFSTNPAPGMTQLINVFNGYQIELQSLDPYPENPATPIEFEDYQATLLVTNILSASADESAR